MMTLKDLPKETVSTPWNRRVYAFFWAPVAAILELYLNVLELAGFGLKVGAALWVVFNVVMLTSSAWTFDLALGSGMLAVGGGLCIGGALLLLAMLGKLMGR